MHKCPAPGCEKQVPQYQLACRDDWYRLPFDLRAGLTRRRSMYGQGSPEHLELLRECLSWYKAAADG